MDSFCYGAGGERDGDIAQGRGGEDDHRDPPRGVLRRESRGGVDRPRGPRPEPELVGLGQGSGGGGEAVAVRGDGPRRRGGRRACDLRLARTTLWGGAGGGGGLLRRDRGAELPEQGQRGRAGGAVL